MGGSIPSLPTKFALVAQLADAPGLGPGCWEFESLQEHYNICLHSPTGSGNRLKICKVMSSNLSGDIKICWYGGIGRRGRFKICCHYDVSVQVRGPAPIVRLSHTACVLLNLSPVEEEGNFCRS